MIDFAQHNPLVAFCIAAAVWIPIMAVVNHYTDRVEGEMTSKLLTRLLVDRGACISMSQARRLVCTGAVTVNGEKVTDPMAEADEGATVQVGTFVASPSTPKERAVKLWLDDTRPPPDATWTVARTADEAIALLRTGAVEEASLDHDLGHCVDCTGCRGAQRDPCPCACHRSGTFVVNWMATENVWPSRKCAVHSANPVGAERMRGTIERYGPYRT